MLLVAIGLLAARFFPRPETENRPPIPSVPLVVLSAPYLDIFHPRVDSGSGKTFEVNVGRADVPLRKGEHVALDVKLPAEERAYLYLFQFDEGEQPKRLWPVGLDHQQPVNSLRYPAEGSSIVLEGDPRRMMFMVGVSQTPLGEDSLSKVDSTAFSLEKDLTPQSPLQEFIYPANPGRKPIRGGNGGELVQLDAKRLSNSPERELQKHFKAFSALVFYYRSTEAK